MNEQAGMMQSVTTQLVTRQGSFSMTVFRDAHGKEHVALRRGHTGIPLVRIQSSCLTGTAFRSVQCECGDQLDLALGRIAEAQHGLLIYLDQEARGHGLFAKAQVLSYLAQGFDIDEAQRLSCVSDDRRDYNVAAAILRGLGIGGPVEILTNNPGKLRDIEQAGIRVAATRPLVPAQLHPSQREYFQTKVARQGHRPEPSLPAGDA